MALILEKNITSIGFLRCWLQENQLIYQINQDSAKAIVLNTLPPQGLSQQIHPLLSLDLSMGDEGLNLSIDNEDILIEGVEIPWLWTKFRLLFCCYPLLSLIVLPLALIDYPIESLTFHWPQKAEDFGSFQLALPCMTALFYSSKALALLLLFLSTLSFTIYYRSRKSWAILLFLSCFSIDSLIFVALLFDHILLGLSFLSSLTLVFMTIGIRLLSLRTGIDCWRYLPASSKKITPAQENILDQW